MAKAKALDIEKAVIYWDTTDPKNPSWAYNVITSEEHLSGALDSTEEATPLAVLIAELRAAGAAFQEIPSYGWHMADDGNGWVRPFPCIPWPNEGAK